MAPDQIGSDCPGHVPFKRLSGTFRLEVVPSHLGRYAGPEVASCRGAECPCPGPAYQGVPASQGIGGLIQSVPESQHPFLAVLCFEAKGSFGGEGEKRPLHR